jgi:alcohol dehydrogenase, propanol-preferring
VCHSDTATVDGLFPIEWPRVPGHEVVGKIDALGSGVQGWTVGQRVGVGFLAGSCGYCEFCRNGDRVNCKNQEYATDPVAALQALGGAQVILVTASSGKVVSQTFKGLRPNGIAVVG